MAYIRGEGKPAADPDHPEECPFCRAPTLSDEDGLIVARGLLVYTVLNLFPYNSGHLMVVCPTATSRTTRRWMRPNAPK